MITVYKGAKQINLPNVDSAYVNSLNSFYARFEDGDCVVFDQVSDESTAPIVDESEVRGEFKRVNARKACGPDRIKPKILKMCSAELARIFTYILNLSIRVSEIPSIWKKSELIPVPKKDKIIELNDLRPVALTSVPMKCAERIILRKVKTFFNPFQDPYQFAYRAGRSVDDAIALFLDNVYKHLDKPKSYCRILFVDFSSAFNTIKPNMLLSKLKNFGINSHIISWIGSFLSNRTQYVKLNNITSSIITTNTGAPQGCVLSPILFTIYTNDCQINNEILKLLKFADDSSIQAFLRSIADEVLYRNYVTDFTKWCEDHNLLLNISKTKELIFDFRTKKEPLMPLEIKGQTVDQVDSYKYLGVTIDNKLSWDEHASLTYKKVNKRMFFLRKLKNFSIDKVLISLFYKAAIQSIITFSIIGWGGNTNGKQKQKINVLIKRAGKLFQGNSPSFDDLFNVYCAKKIKAITKDPTHPLHSQICRSPRTNRIQLVLTKTERYRCSFFPYSVKFLQEGR